MKIGKVNELLAIHQRMQPLWLLSAINQSRNFLVKLLKIISNKTSRPFITFSISTTLSTKNLSCFLTCIRKFITVNLATF